MKTRIMLDLETLGTTPGSVILSIGAAKFSHLGVTDSFYMRVDPKSCASMGMTMDPSTVMWWLEQEEGPRLELTKPGKHIVEALSAFSTWAGEDVAEMWGNGVGFDNALLSSAYEKALMTRPWDFRADRCYRTMKNMFPSIKMKRSGDHHNAVDDARSQAEHLMAILTGAGIGIKG